MMLTIVWTAMFLMQQIDFQEYDYISDSFASEAAILIAVERLWSRVRGYFDEKAAKKHETDLDKRLDKMNEQLAILRGKDQARYS